MPAAPSSPKPRPVAAAPAVPALVVPVLGMHRSGTSMFTRALDLLGMDLGEPLMKPQADNPKGFWENEFFYQVNVRILHAMGRHVSGYGRRDELLQIPELSARVERTEDVLGTVQGYIEEQFAAEPLWGWKDPRSVLLFPFWLRCLLELGVRRVHPAVITRHPVAVVRSLVRRTDLGGLAPRLGCSAATLGLEMWTAYSHMLLDIVEETGCFVSRQESFLEADGAEAELRRWADSVGLAVDDEAMAAALGWLDPGAVHHLAPEPLDLPGMDEALILHEELEAHARAQHAAWATAA